MFTCKDVYIDVYMYRSWTIWTFGGRKIAVLIAQINLSALSMYCIVYTIHVFGVVCICGNILNQQIKFNNQQFKCIETL